MTPDDAASDDGTPALGHDRERAILVVADHALTGALVESLVEVAGHHPVTLERGERPVDAIGRVHPELVLLDAEHEAATDDALYQRARESGSRLLIFASGGDRRALARLGERRGVATCRLPIPYREFAAVIARALEAR